MCNYIEQHIERFCNFKIKVKIKKIIVVCFIRSFYSLITVLTLDFNCLRLTVHVGVGHSGNNSNSHSLVSLKMHSAVTK